MINEVNPMATFGWKDPDQFAILMYWRLAGRGARISLEWEMRCKLAPKSDLRVGGSFIEERLTEHASMNMTVKNSRVLGRYWKVVGRLGANPTWSFFRPKGRCCSAKDNPSSLRISP
jgi:hypothetical protein